MLRQKDRTTAVHRDVLRQTYGQIEDNTGQLAPKTITIALDKHTNVYGLKSIINVNPNIVFIVHRNGCGDYLCDVLDADNILWR